jgi:hypothetical protein
MDSDREIMLHQLMQDEEEVVSSEEEKLLIMVPLFCLRARINAPP